MSISTIGSHFILFAREFPFDITFQSFTEEKTYCLLYPLPAEIRTLSPGPKKTGILINNKEGVLAMGIYQKHLVC